MKKMFLSFLIMFAFVKEAIVQDGIDLVKKESYKQDALASAIELYVETFGVNPNTTLSTALTQLRTAGFLDTGFTFSGSLSFTTTSFSITSTIANLQTYQRDYFLNDYARGRAINPTVSGNDITTTFYFGRKAIYSKNMKTSGVNFVQETTPTGSANQTWWDTSKQQMYIKIGTNWVNLAVRKLWIVRNLTELSSYAVTPNENDGAMVHDGTTLSKYLYSGGAWRLIPQTIPFTYNGAF